MNKECVTSRRRNRRRPMITPKTVEGGCMEWNPKSTWTQVDETQPGIVNTGTETCLEVGPFTGVIDIWDVNRRPESLLPDGVCVCAFVWGMGVSGCVREIVLSIKFRKVKRIKSHFTYRNRKSQTERITSRFYVTTWPDTVMIQIKKVYLIYFCTNKFYVNVYHYSKPIIKRFP